MNTRFAPPFGPFLVRFYVVFYEHTLRMIIMIIVTIMIMIIILIIMVMMIIIMIMIIRITGAVGQIPHQPR